MSLAVKKLLNAIAITAILALLYVILYFIVGNELIIASPILVIEEIFNLFLSGDFYLSLANTLLRVVVVFAISFVLAVIFGVISSKNKVFERVLTVISSFMRSLPTLAVLLIILVAVSTLASRDFAPVIVSFLSLFPMLYTSILAGINKVNEMLGDMVKVYKIPLFKSVTRVYMPSMAKRLIIDSTTALSFALKLVVSAEILANVFKSIGGLMQTASTYSSTAELTALTILVCFIGLIIELIGKFFAQNFGEN